MFRSLPLQSRLSSFSSSPVEVVFARRRCSPRLPVRSVLSLCFRMFASRVVRRMVCILLACLHRSRRLAFDGGGRLLCAMFSLCRFLAGCHSLRFRLSKNARARKGGRLAGQESRTGRAAGTTFLREAEPLPFCRKDTNIIWNCQKSGGVNV